MATPGFQPDAFQPDAFQTDVSPSPQVGTVWVSDRAAETAVVMDFTDEVLVRGFGGQVRVFP